MEDEHKIARSIKRGLEQESYAVDIAFDGQEGLFMASTESYDVVILDLMLPKIDGIEVCRRLRQQRIRVPILILTALDRLDDKVNGLNAGADDYLVKPFAFAELLARVKALSRRPRESLDTMLSVDDLQLDTLTFEVTRAGKRIELSKKEFALLEYLMRHDGRILTKDHLINHVWDYDADVLPNTVEVYIGYLRNKIDRPFKGCAPLIHTARGFGYRIGRGDG